MFNSLSAVLLFLVLCLILLGALLPEKIGQVGSSVSEPDLQMRVLAYARTPSLYASSTPQPSATPTPLSAVALAQPTFIAQTVAAGDVKATLEAAQAAATQTSIARSQEMQSITAGATATAIAQQIRAADDAQESSREQDRNNRILFTLVEISFIVFAVIAVVGWIMSRTAGKPANEKRKIDQPQ